MQDAPPPPATLAQPSAGTLVLSGAWTAAGLGRPERLLRQLQSVHLATAGPAQADAAGISALDTAGVWVLQRWLQTLHGQGVAMVLSNFRPEFSHLFDALAPRVAPAVSVAPAASAGGTTRPSWASLATRAAVPLTQLGRQTMALLEQALALLAFVGETAHAFARSAAHPARWRWRPILFNIRSAGFDALPLVGLLAFLLGVVVAYQGASPLRQYGASIFVADLVGLSMLREFAPLITAIVIAGRSGSAYAAQIGTMAVTEEIDAMRTLGIAPLELLVLPKLIALVIALPLLTVFADATGVAGGMVMAQAQLGVSYAEFAERLAEAVSVSTLLLGVGKAPVFAAVIAMVGCFQGLRTRGGADSVGRQTTLAVVQSIFLVIVADALFSVAFSALDL